MAGFDFETNPFGLLRVSPRDGPEALAMAVEEAVGAGRLAEQEAHSAQRALMAPKPRLDAELAWFPGIAPSAAVKLLSALGQGKIPAGGWPELPAIVQANVLAHQATRRDADALRKLVAAQSQLDPDAVLNAVNADRSVAGFPPIDRALVDQALAGLRRAHVGAAIEAIMASPDPPGAAATLCREFIAAVDARREFVEDAIERYDAAAAPRIAAAEQGVQAAVRAYGDKGSDGDLDHVRAAMTAWRRETEARRLVFSSKKLDEPRSAELFRAVRDLGKDLVAQRELPERAQALFEALRSAFIDVPSAADKMDRDLAEIAEAVMFRRFQAVAGEFAAALEEARADIKKAALAIRSKGFERGAKGLSGCVSAPNNDPRSARGHS